MRALFAIAHKLARAVYRTLTTGERYKDLGADYLDSKNKPNVLKALIARLKRVATADQVLASFGIASDSLGPAPEISRP